jgi:hypothetical protein
MNKDFIPYEQALELKELGFDEPNYFLKWYDSKGEIREGLGLGEVKAPLYQQAFRWFRENYNLHAEPYTADMGAIEYCFQIRDLYSEKYVYDNFIGAGSSYMGTFNTPEEAELACLNKLIEIVKQPKKD